MPSQQERPQVGERSRSNGRVAIDAEDVHLTYDNGTEAVSGVSLDVEPGEFFGFLGPNGAGKTTTIKTLVTLLHPTRGAVCINGYDTTDDPHAVRESIGYMAQETSIDLELTPRENLRVACRMYGVPQSERETRIDALLNLVDLRDVEDTRADTFSGGMQKRLDTATVLVHRPPVVFLDEPTTGLDPEARLRVWEYFEEINDRGTTVFLTTQYLEEANELCDRLAVLQDGRITHKGTPNDLKSAVGADTVRFALEDPSAENCRRAKRVVQNVDELEAMTIETTTEGLTIEAQNARSAMSNLFTVFAAVNISIIDFEIQSPTLDDVFLALTGEDEATDNGSADASTQVEKVVR